MIWVNPSSAGLLGEENIRLLCDLAMRRKRPLKTLAESENFDNGRKQQHSLPRCGSADSPEQAADQACVHHWRNRLDRRLTGGDAQDFAAVSSNRPLKSATRQVAGLIPQGLAFGRLGGIHFSPLFVGFSICLLLLQVGCLPPSQTKGGSKHQTEVKITFLRVWNDDGTPATSPSSCRLVGSAHGSGRTNGDALRSFTADALKKGGNAATLLSGRRRRTSSGMVITTHAGLVYKCAPRQLTKYRTRSQAE